MQDDREEFDRATRDRNLIGGREDTERRQRFETAIGRLDAEVAAHEAGAADPLDPDFSSGRMTNGAPVGGDGDPNFARSSAEGPSDESRFGERLRQAVRDAGGYLDEDDDREMSVIAEDDLLAVADAIDRDRKTDMEAQRYFIVGQVEALVEELREPAPAVVSSEGRAENRYALDADLFLKRLGEIFAVVAFAVTGLFFVSRPVLAQKIPGVGYNPPANAVVFQCDTSPENLITRCGGKTTPLNSAVPWSGSNGDVTGYVGRYLGGRVECAAAWICGVGNENECLNASQALREMFQRGELGDRNAYTGEPTRRECHDFGAQNPNLGSIGGSSNGLRKQPTEPPGCCRTTLPCVVDEPGRLPGTIWQEAVLTPQGGRKGCFMIQPGRPADPPPPQPPPRIDPNPVPAPHCFDLLVTAAGVGTMTPKPCPPPVQ